MDLQNSKNYFPKFAIIFFLLSGAILLFTPHAWWPSFYDLPYMGIAALVCAVLIYIAPEHLKTPLAVILLLNASGDLGLYELYRYGFEYDKVIHLVSPTIATLVLARYLGIRRAILIVLGTALAWEFFEYICDALIKTHLFGVYRQHVWSDTMWDLIMNTLGVTIAFSYDWYSRNFHQGGKTV